MELIMDIPESIQQELDTWNNGTGIDLESCIDYMGRYDLAMSYCTLFWPTFQWIDDYIVREGLTANYLNSWVISTQNSYDDLILDEIDEFDRYQLEKVIEICKKVVVYQKQADNYLPYPEPKSNAVTMLIA